MSSLSQQATVSHSEVITALDGFKALEQEWQTLLDAIPDAYLNLDHAWLRLWLETFEEQPLVVLVRDESGRLVGAAPFKLNHSRTGLLRKRLRQVQFIGTDPTVYERMRILIHPEADRENVLREIAAKLLLVRNQWDIIDLRFCDQSEQLSILATCLAVAGVSVSSFPAMSIPYMRLPATCAEYEERFRKKGFKKDLKRVHNHLGRDFPEQPLQVEAISPSSQGDTYLADFYDRHSKYWAQRGLKSDFQRYSNLGAFYRSVYNHFGQASHPGKGFKFSRLFIGDITLGYQFVLIYRNTHVGHIVNFDDAYKKYRPGVLHFEKMILEAIEHGAGIFEFGRGDESYKSQWADDVIPLYSQMYFKNGWPRLLFALDEWLKTLLKR